MRNFFALASVSAFTILAGCSGAPASAGIGLTPGETVIVGGTEPDKAVTTPTGTDCITVGTGCIKPQEKCGEKARADVVVDKSGNVVDVVCYDTKTPPRVVGDGSAPASGVNAGNNETIGFDGADDGVDVKGDVTLGGNNATVYGQGAAVSVVDGSLSIPKNNGIVRGVRFKGDASVTGNDARLLLLVIDGDLLVEGNNTVIVGVTVFGKIVVKGNNTKIIGSRVAGGIEVEGKNTVCDDTRAFRDADGNFLVADTELGDAITCAGK